jgi:FimV-like protein
VDDYISEKEQIEQVRQWLSENGRSILTGLAIGLALVVGLWFWRPYRDGRLAAASEVYAELQTAVDNREQDKALELATRLDGYWRTPYATQAALALARMYMEADEPEPAAAQLQKVVSGGHDDVLAEIARIRLAKVRLYQKQADAALTVLGTDSGTKFAPLYHEVRGDALLALGRSDEARSEYEQALATLEPGAADRTVLEMKLNDIAPAAPSPAAESGS